MNVIWEQEYDIFKRKKLVEKTTGQILRSLMESEPCGKESWEGLR